MSCCRSAAPAGADKTFFDDLKSVLDRLEERPSDRIIADSSVATKKITYDRLVRQASRLSTLLGAQ